MKHQSYLNRALKARDPRYARIFGKLGYDVTALATEQGADANPIPEGWRDLPWPALKALATSFSNESIKTKDDAKASIELELERRKKVRL